MCSVKSVAALYPTECNVSCRFMKIMNYVEVVGWLLIAPNWLTQHQNCIWSTIASIWMYDCTWLAGKIQHFAHSIKIEILLWLFSIYNIWVTIKFAKHEHLQLYHQWATVLWNTANSEKNMCKVCMKNVEFSSHIHSTGWCLPLLNTVLRDSV